MENEKKVIKSDKNLFDENDSVRLEITEVAGLCVLKSIDKKTKISTKLKVQMGVSLVDFKKGCANFKFKKAKKE